MTAGGVVDTQKSDVLGGLRSYDVDVVCQSPQWAETGPVKVILSIADSCLVFGCGKEFLRLIHANVSSQAVSYPDVFSACSGVLTRSGVSPQTRPHRPLYHI